ncbi:MAG: membrane protein insertase YidC [Armatimonadetes bacterium]|nr:membrane protein insertase YidC [Armatimonadota bacterium]
MSKQQRPAPNPLITMLMWGAFLFLGYQLFFNKGAPDTRTSEELFETIVEHNQKGEDVSLGRQIPPYLDKLKQDKKEGKLSDEELDLKQLEAAVLYAHTQFASGLHQDKRKRIDAAYNTLKGKFQKYSKNKELWEETAFDVEPYGEQLPQYQITADELYTALVAELSHRNKDAVVVGYVPGYRLIDFFVRLTGSKPNFSYWFAALLLAVFVRLAVFPLAQKQFIWGRKMAHLAPLTKEIQAKYKDKKTGKVSDPQKLQTETMELYKKYGMNPLAGCWPMMIQMPLFLIIFYCMRLYQFEFTKGHFLWVQEGADRFLGIPLGPNLGERDPILIVIYGISMVVATLMTPASDPSQQRQHRMIGIGFALMFSVMMFFDSFFGWYLPSAFIVYWIFTNMLTTAQSLYVHRMNIPAPEPVQTAAGGIIPTTATDKNGKANAVDPGFFGKTGKQHSKKKKKKRRR